MPLLSGKEAILSAARRIAELGDDALDEDLLDAELALAGPVRDEDEAFAEAPGDGEPPLRPEDLGLPPRLSAWLARHGGRDVRRAFGAAARAAQRLVPDAEGHVALGRAAGAPGSASAVGARPRYAPLEERVVPLSEAAAPTPRAFEHVPPAELERREALKLEARSAEAWRRGERAKGVDPKAIDNAAVSATIKNLIVAGSRREREIDLPKGAGPAGRHEPTTRSDERVGSETASSGNLPGLASSRASEREGLRAKTEPSARRRLAGAERRAAANALLGRLPDGERPVIATRASLTSGGVVRRGGGPARDPLKVPRAARQATLDALVAAALAAEAEARGIPSEDAFAAMDARWLKARPKTRRRAIAAGVEAEARVFEAAASAVAYRGLAARALRDVAARRETARDADAEDAATDVSGDRPDARSVVPSAARARGRGALVPADQAAVAVAVAFEREGFERTRRRDRGVGFVAAARAGALLQHYANADADRVDLRAATTPLGASAVFWAETARISNPKRPRGGSFARLPVGRSGRAKPPRASNETTTKGVPFSKPEARREKEDPNENERVFAASPARANANAAVEKAVRALVRSFLEPFLDVGTITEAFARSVETKAAAKVTHKKRDEPDASFLRREKEREAVKALTREYVRRGERCGDRPRSEARKRARASEIPVRVEADSGGTRNPPPPTFDFDVDDL